MKLKIVTRQVQLDLQDDDGRSLLFAQIFINGVVGTIYSLNGRGLSGLFEHRDVIFNGLGIKELCLMCEAHIKKRLLMQDIEGYYFQMSDRVFETDTKRFEYFSIIKREDA